MARDEELGEIEGEPMGLDSPKAESSEEEGAPKGGATPWESCCPCSAMCGCGSCCSILRSAQLTAYTHVVLGLAYALIAVLSIAAPELHFYGNHEHATGAKVVYIMQAVVGIGEFFMGITGIAATRFKLVVFDPSAFVNRSRNFYSQAFWHMMVAMVFLIVQFALTPHADGRTRVLFGFVILLILWGWLLFVVWSYKTRLARGQPVVHDVQVDRQVVEDVSAGVQMVKTAKPVVEDDEPEDERTPGTRMTFFGEVKITDESSGGFQKFEGLNELVDELDDGDLPVPKGSVVLETIPDEPAYAPEAGANNAEEDDGAALVGASSLGASSLGEEPPLVAQVPAAETGSLLVEGEEFEEEGLGGASLRVE